MEKIVDFHAEDLSPVFLRLDDLREIVEIPRESIEGCRYING